MKKKTQRNLIIVIGLIGLMAIIYFFGAKFATLVYTDVPQGVSKDWYIPVNCNGYGRKWYLGDNAPSNNYSIGALKFTATTTVQQDDVYEDSMGCSRTEMTVTYPNGTIDRFAIGMINHCSWTGCDPAGCDGWATTGSRYVYKHVIWTGSTDNARNRIDNNTPMYIPITDKISLSLDQSSWIGGTSSDVPVGLIQLKYNVNINTANMFTIQAPQDTTLLFTGENRSVNVTIVNNFMDKMPGSVKVVASYETPTGLASSTSVIANLTFNLGANTIQVPIPTSAFGKITLNIQPELYLQGATGLTHPTTNADTAKYISFGYTCSSLSYYSESACGKIIPLAIEGVPSVSVSYLINPQPLYILPQNNVCPANYTLKLTGYCIRNDVLNNQLSCMQLGCPVFNNYSYQCTSAGICAETVYQQRNCTNDTQCPTDTKCDVGSGLCINTVIYNEILQCVTASDCANPCVGKTISCDVGKCTYAGECAVTTVGCQQLGCPETYTCNSARNVCERTQDIFHYISIIDQSTLIAISVIAIFGIGAFMLTRKRR